MAECPICGLGERCHNHWVAVQEPNGEVEFQVGAMTASEDNLVMLRNKLQNPPLPLLFEKISLQPQWVREEGRLLAYLAWPLELRGAVHRALFPNGQPGAPPLKPTPVFKHRLQEIELTATGIDWEQCLPDEVLYRAEFSLGLEGLGKVKFTYLQLVWAEGIEWAPLLSVPGVAEQAKNLVRLLIGGILDPLRAAFAGQMVDVLADDHPEGVAAGAEVDEIALLGPPEKHLGEEIEHAINERRLQPMLREGLLRLTVPVVIH